MSMSSVLVVLIIGSAAVVLALGLALAGLAVALEDAILLQRGAASGGRHLAQLQRRSGGRIHLLAVVHLEHFHVVVGPQGAGHARLNIATSPERLTRVVERMGAALA